MASFISRTQPNDPRVRYLLDHGLPFATHGRTEMGVVHPYFDYDNEAFSVEALRILKDKGRRHVILLGPPPGLTFHKHTHQGFQRGVQELALRGAAIGTHDIDSSLDEIRALGLALAQRHDRPDGVVSSSVTASMALATGLRDGGLAIGQDFDIVTKHSTALLSLIWPEIIAMHEDFRQAGFELARMLMARIAGGEDQCVLVGPHEVHSR